MAQLKQVSKRVKLDSKLVSLYPKKVGFDLCPGCIDFADQALDAILNIILQVGVVGSCGDLCSAVADKTGSQALGVVCNLLCDIAGIDEFINLINKADLDPIYYCELLHACKIFDQGDAKITDFSIVPVRGPQGTTFTAVLTYVSTNGTGTGEIDIEIDTVDGIPLGDSFLNLPQAPGTYGVKIDIKAQPDPDCDPTQGPCEEWLPGPYAVKIGN